MKLVAQDPQAWFFLEAEAGYYLSVRCQQSFVEFEILLKLTPEEYREYHALGSVYLAYLAARVSYWPREYASRDQSREWGAEVTRTVLQWRAASVTATDANTSR